MLSPETYDKPDKKLIGSLMIIEGETLDEIRKLVESDVYYKTNVVSCTHVVGPSSQHD